MYGHPELESLAHPSGFDAGPDPTPESGVEQAEADALLDAEGGVGIEPQGIFGERAGEGPVAPEFVFWRIDATLELVRGEAVLLLEPPGMLHQLVGAPDLRLPRLGIRVPEEEVAREGHPVPELAAEQRVNRDSELLPHKIQAPKLYGGMKLGAVVVEAGCRVHDLEPERLELEGVMADEVGLETFEGLLRALPSSPISPRPTRPSSVSTSTIVRTKRPQWAPLACWSGASNGTVTVVALMSAIFKVPPMRPRDYSGNRTPRAASKPPSTL